MLGRHGIAEPLKVLRPVLPEHLGHGGHRFTGVSSRQSFEGPRCGSALASEVLEDPSLPFDGPGFWPNNGNFVIVEMEVDHTEVPEPSTVILAALALLALLAHGRRRRA